MALSSGFDAGGARPDHPEEAASSPAASPAPPPPCALPHPAKAPQHERVLVVSDDPVFRATAVAALYRAGYLADGVDGVEPAAETIGLGVHACGVFDMHLAGPAATGLLPRSRVLAPRMPVVILTEGVDPQEAIWALRRGAYEVVGKPVTSAGLCAVVRRAIDGAAAPEPGAAADDGLEPEEAEPELPAQRFAAYEPRPAPGGDRAPHGARRRVLVVDDDLILGRSIATLLEEYDVVFAQSAAGALGRVASGRGFAAAVCDFRMPGMDGIQFHDEVEKLDPDLARRIVYVTGWADAPEFEAFLRRTSCTCLPKPFDPVKLRRAVGFAAERDQT